MIVVALLCALVIGVMLGLLGGGGSILAVPVFVYVLGFEPKQAIALSLPAVAVTALIGAASHWRASRVNVRVAVAFGALTMLGAFAGARLSTLVTGRTQLAVFALVALGAAVAMLGGGSADATSARPRGRRWVAGAAGLGVGVLTGFVGVGGGFLIVPALTLFADMPIKQAVGTSLLVIALSATAGTLGHLGLTAVPWAFLLQFMALAVVGSTAGAWLVRYVPALALRRAFSLFLLLMGSLILLRSL